MRVNRPFEKGQKEWGVSMQNQYVLPEGQMHISPGRSPWWVVNSAVEH